jgi:hypothetical protein
MIRWYFALTGLDLCRFLVSPVEYCSLCQETAWRMESTVRSYESVCISKLQKGYLVVATHEARCYVNGLVVYTSRIFFDLMERD